MKQQFLKSPLFLLAFLVGLIFLVEISIMLFLEGSLSQHRFLNIILDPLLLSAVLLPFLYYLVYRPLTRQVFEQKKTMEWLHKNVKELADYKYALNEGANIVITDKDGTILHVNDVFCCTTQYSREELIGQNPRLLNSGHHPKEFWENMYTTLASGKIWRKEVKNKAKDGTFHWLDTTIVPFMDAGGKPYQYLAMRYNITKRKEIEDRILKMNEALEQQVKERTKESEERRKYFKALIENSSEAVMLINCEGKLTYQSPAVEEISGYSAAETYGKAAAEFIHPDDVVEFAALLLQLIQAPGTSVSKQYRARHKDGSYRWIEGTITNHLHEENIKALIANYRDITLRKQAEEAIAELNNTLEERVRSRTIELVEANTALEAFSYSVSHDLRSPVRSLIGFSKMISKEYGNTLHPEVKELFDHIENSGKRMNAIIEDLLALSKYGKEKLHIAEVDMTKLFSSVCDNLQFNAPHQARIEINDLPTIQADGSMLEQVLVNLLSNAIKYSSKKESPHVRIGYEKKPGEFVFYVNDNGAGFDMQNYDRLFGAFQRLHSMSEFEGTGVGLTLIKRIIEKHNGKVWAEAKVNEGATFYFSIPAAGSN